MACIYYFCFCLFGQHQRICLRVDVATPGGLLQVFVTHLSLSEAARDRSVNEIWTFMRQSGSGPQVLLGDLNANPDTLAMKFLAGNAVFSFFTYFVAQFYTCSHMLAHTLSLLSKSFALPTPFSSHTLSSVYASVHLISNHILYIGNTGHP